VGQPVLRIPLWFIQPAELDRIQPELLCHFVHRTLERQHAGPLARRTHRPCRQPVHPHDVVMDAAVLGGIQPVGTNAARLEEILTWQVGGERVVSDAQ
jgi:hypothetical protein